MTFKKITDQEYFSDEALNASKLKKYIKSPARAIYDQFKGSKSTELGSLVHCMVFEAEEVKNRFLAEPKEGSLKPEMLTLPEHVIIQNPLRECGLLDDVAIVPEEFLTKAGTVAVKKQTEYQVWTDSHVNKVFIHTEKEALDLLVERAKQRGATVIGNYKQLKAAWQLEKALKGIAILDRSSYAKALWIYRSLKRHARAKKWLWHPAGQPEIAIFANVPEFGGELCKGKLDYYISGKTKQGQEFNIILDLKTLGRDSHMKLELLSKNNKEATENKLRLVFEDLGYDMSLAFYNLLHKAAKGSPATSFIIIGVQTDKYPYEVFEINIDPNWIKLGEYKITKLHKLYKKCLEKGFYPRIDQVVWNEETADWDFFAEGVAFTISPTERTLKKLEGLNV